MNVAALLHDSPSDDHRKRQENKEKEREKGQSSQNAPPHPPSSQQQQQPQSAGPPYAFRSYSPLGGPGQQGQRPTATSTGTFDARLSEREVRERAVGREPGREREQESALYPSLPTRPYSLSHSHPQPPPMTTTLPPPPIPVSAVHGSHPHAPRHQHSYSHSPPSMLPMGTGTPPFLSPLSTPRDPVPQGPPSGAAGSSAALPALAGIAPAPDHLADYGTHPATDRDGEGVNRRRSARSMSIAAPAYRDQRDRPPLAMRPRSPDSAAYRRGPGERAPSMAGASATRSPIQPGPGFSVVPPPSAQSPHLPRATPPGAGIGPMPPPPPSSSSINRRGQQQHMSSSSGNPHAGVPGASTLSSPAMDSLRPHENEMTRRSGPSTPSLPGPATPVAASMTAAAAALPPLAARNDRDRERYERYPGEDPHQQPPHHLSPHPLQSQVPPHLASQQRRAHRSSSMSGGVAPGSSSIGAPPPAMGQGVAGSPELAGRARDEERERRADRERERDLWEMDRVAARERSMGGPSQALQQQQHQHRLHHVQHPHHNHHPEHLQHLQYRERGLPPEKDREPQPMLGDAPPATRTNSSRQVRREKTREPAMGFLPDPINSRGNGSGILTLAPPGVTVSKDPPPQPPAGPPPPASTPLPLLPAPSDSSRPRSPSSPTHPNAGQGPHQQYSPPTLHLGPAGPHPSHAHGTPYGYAPPPPSSAHSHNEMERDRKQRLNAGEYAGGGPVGSAAPSPRMGTPSGLAGPGAGGNRDIYHQAPYHSGSRPRERSDRDFHGDPLGPPSHLHRDPYHSHRRPGQSPPPMQSREPGGGRHVPPPPSSGQDGVIHRLERAPPSQSIHHTNYPPNMAPPTSAPAIHHSQGSMPYPALSRHHPPASAPLGGSFPSQGLHGMEPAPLTIQLVPQHMTLPIAPLSPPNSLDYSPQESPLHIGTFVYPRLPFPYTFPNVTASPKVDSKEGPKHRKRDPVEDLDEGYLMNQPSRARPRRERETHVTIIIPNAALPTSPTSPSSPISPGSSSSSTTAIRKLHPPRIWGGGLPTDPYSLAYFTRVYGAQQSVALSSSSRGPGLGLHGRRDLQEPQLRRVYTDDSDVRLCALHSGCVSWTGLRRAKRRGMDLRVKLAIGRDMGRYVGGLPSASVVGASPLGEPIDVGLGAEEEGVEEGEVEVMEEKERLSLMESLRSADWMSGHDGCAFEVLEAEWVQRGTARSLGLRNRAQRLKEYGEQRAAIMSDEGMTIGKRKRRMQKPPYPGAVTLSDTEKLMSRERTIIFGGWVSKEVASSGYKYDFGTFNSVLFRAPFEDTQRPNDSNDVSLPALRSSKRRKVNGTGPTGDADADVEMNDAKLSKATTCNRKSIVLENDWEKFLLLSLPSPTVDREKGKGQESGKENLPASHTVHDEKMIILEKDAGMKRRFKLCILRSGDADEMKTESKVLRASLGEDDVRFEKSGLAISLGAGEEAGEEEGKSEGLFIRVERWRWATAEEEEELKV